MRKCALAAFSVAFALATFNAALEAQAQDKTFELKLSHWVPPSHPAAEGAGGLGRPRSKRLRAAPSSTRSFPRSSSARPSITTTWRATASPISPTSIPAISRAGSRSSVLANCRSCVGNAKGGSQALDAWYRKYADNEMKDVKFCLAFMHDPGTFHSRTKKIVVPGDIKGMKIRPAHATMATFVTHARRHQRAVERAGGARHPREGRGRRGDVPVGLGAAVRHRQGHEVPHGRAALRHHLRLRVQQGALRTDVGRRRRR